MSTPAQERRKAKHVEYMRQYRAAHPDTELKRRIVSAINLLRRHGYVVTPPKPQGDN